MGRPRHSTDPKAKVSIRLTREALTELDARGPNRSAIIESLILSPTVPALRAEITKKPATTACPYPKDQRQPMSFGTHYRCLACDTVIRKT